MATSTLVATAGGASSNSYATLVEADQFHDDRPASGTTWADATTATKTAALLWAAKLLDSLFEWAGWVTDADQAMLWPRVGIVKRNGYSLDQDTVPQELKDAQAEYARQLIADSGRSDDSDIEAQGIKRIKAGPVTLDFKDSVFNKVVPDAVALLIPDDWYSRIRGRASSTRRLARA